VTELLSVAVKDEMLTVRDRDEDGIVKAVTVGGVVSAGVIELDGDEEEPCPTELVALTVNVYDVPFVRPVITWVSDVEPALESVPPLDEVTVYPSIALPPLETGAAKLTLAERLSGVATTEVGAPGTTALAV